MTVTPSSHGPLAAPTTALVTGAAGGLGTVIVNRLAAAGYRVLAADITEPGRPYPDGFVSCRLDVTDERSWTAAVRRCTDELGGLGVLVNAAGVNIKGPVTSLSTEDYMTVVRVNQLGTFLGLRTAGAAMASAGAGSIVLITSIMAYQGGLGSIAYTASKFAVRGMTQVAAVELGPRGVRVNSVAPGIIDAGMGRRTVGDRHAEAARTVPLSRLGVADEVAEAVLYLAGPAGAYCNGTHLVVDGGWLAGRSTTWHQVGM